MEILVETFSQTKSPILVRWCLLLALLLTVGASGSAQSSMVAASHELQASEEAGRGGPPKPAACRDTTPHTKAFVTVDRGVQLEVLDWGGADKPATMVLLTGLGDNAHVYDQFAFQFTDYFHVIGITRRGFLPSSQPEDGYDVGTRARDDISVLRALGIGKAVFVGHSVAGSELSAIAVNYGHYAERLVYLDAFDLSTRFELPDVPPVPYTDADGRSLQILIAATQRLENTLRPAQEVCISLQFDENGMIKGDTTPAWVSEAILRGVQQPASSPTDWATVEAPRLGIFSQPSVQARLAYYWYLSAEDKKKFDENWPGIVKWYASRTEEFAVQESGRPKPIVYRLPDAPHYFYLNNDQAFVVRVMREFLLGKVGP